MNAALNELTIFRFFLKHISHNCNCNLFKIIFNSLLDGKHRVKN